MPEVIATFGAADGWHERADPLAQTMNIPLGELSNKGFDFAERHLNRVKVRRVLRRYRTIAPAASIASSLSLDYFPAQN